ncbi:centrosome and spindle pole-associated protein 1 isoform X3 [Hippoglossus stenolepis]|uniref:centrosome and spindle pole-associated protein 1 isoform X3 n=1 Tax=Hippoglossus stenolepis TaxID=195615 RepID=UPI001FAF7653|nr:centrosome and spindle pole-associated protein 1 isoform X3 [Hippoglossus stenolepis]
MPPASAVQGVDSYPDRVWGLSLLLGTDYERKKQKLNQERQQEYQLYIAKQKDGKTSEPRPQPQVFSLPIIEKKTAQEKLREDRKKEYNLFLKEKAQSRRFKRGTSPITFKPGQVQSSDAAHTSSPASPLPTSNNHTNRPPPIRRVPASKRDAAMWTEAGNNGKSRGTWNRSQRRQAHGLLYRPVEPCDSEEESLTDREELDFRHRRRKDRNPPESEGEEERRECRANRARQDKQEMEAPTVHDQNNNDLLWNSDLHMQDSMRRAARYGPVTNKDKAEFATGLLIGAPEEKGASQRRKEQYKQELLKQIAEKKRNKFREKKLQLRVGATGATDPEKKPERIKQFGAVNRRHVSSRRDVPYTLGVDLEAEEMEPNPQRGPPGKFQVDPSTALGRLPGNTEPAQGVPSLGYFNDDYHRGFSNMLGEVTIPRVAGVPPPIPPTVNDIYRTPYDAAYYYYGSRNPLEPNLPHHQNSQHGWVQQPGTLQPPLLPGRRTESVSIMSHIGELPEDKSKKRRESEVSHQEALKQQIKESEERKRREKEEKLRYEAETEAEMVVYNPWGRSGGGAPIKDQKGNLISDLDQMHRINMELNKNPVLKNREQNLLKRNGDTPGDEVRAPQRLNAQESYKVDLKQQMEENKRKKEKETERKRMEEEKDMRRIVEECARLQQKYDEEHRRHKEKVKSSSNEPDTHCQEEEKKVKQEQETVEKVPRSTRDREAKTPPLSYKQREKSPPIPTLQRKTNIVASRPSSDERTVSAPHSVPVKMPPPRDPKDEVIRELSVLRRHLRKEQMQLEAQMNQTDRQERSHTPSIRSSRRPRGAAAAAHRDVEQPPTSRTDSVTAPVNTKNIYSSSRAEVLRMFPATAADVQTLDVQQQALLQEYRRKISLMRIREHDLWNVYLNCYHHTNKPTPFILNDSLLPSESTLSDGYGGDICGQQAHQRGSPQPSAEHQERTPQRRTQDIFVNQRERDIEPDVEPDAESPKLPTSQNERLSVDEGDFWSLRSAPERRVSVESIATEPWLRPGTSATMKGSACRKRLDTPPPGLTHRVT